MPMTPKVAVGGSAAGASGAASVILIWILGHWVTVPPEIATAIAALIAAAASLIAGYAHTEPGATQPPPAP